MRYTEDGEYPCSQVFFSPDFDLTHYRLTMRKASGLLNRIELAMCLTECFRNFIEVRLFHLWCVCTFSHPPCRRLAPREPFQSPKPDGEWAKAVLVYGILC